MTKEHFLFGKLGKNEMVWEWHWMSSENGEPVTAVMRGKKSEMMAKLDALSAPKLLSTGTSATTHTSIIRSQQ